jgi:hypothetical protein
MFLAGHISDMISRIKANEAVRKSRREKNNKLRKKYIKACENENYHQFVDKKIPKRELEIIKAKIRREIKNERQKEIVETISLTALVVIGIVFFVIYLLGKFKNVNIF